MANTLAIRQRINSVRNTRQITRAMQLVAASKMKRAQDEAERTRDYFTLATEILTRLRQLTNVNKHPLYRQHTIRARLHIVIASDRGLAGAYNNNLFKQLTTELKQDQTEKVASHVISIGRQAHRFVSKLHNVEIMAAYDHFPDHPTANDIRPILLAMVDAFTHLQVDAADVIYTDFKSSVLQLVRSVRLLPVAFQPVPIEANLGRADFEPSPAAVLEGVTMQLLESQLNQAFSESQASEHTMRMIAMKNATDNANDLIDDLTLEFNTARQAAITQELAEITGGAEAIK